MSTLYFIKKDSLSNKMALFAVLGVLYFIGLGFYLHLDTARKSFKPYYLQSYIAVLTYDMGRVIKPLTSSSQVVATDSRSATAANAGSVPVLLYHGLLPSTDGSNVTLTNFIAQMKALKAAGYQTVSIDDLNAFLKGEKALPPKSFVLTFDDGRKDSYYPANPILKALGFNAVMFAIADYSQENNSNYYLSSDEIKKMADSSTWQIESHTKTHRDLTTVPVEQLPDEISGSKSSLENLIGKPIIAFAYPFGEFGERSIDLVDQSDITALTKATYAMSFYQYSTGERFSQAYPAVASSTHAEIKRINVRPAWSASDLLSMLESGSAKTLPFNARLDKSDGWVSTLWGDVELPNQNLGVHSSASSTGSAVILDGSKLWRDYDLEANLNWQSGSNVYLWARYQNDSNYVACNFGQDLVHLEVTENGVTTVIRGEKSDLTKEVFQSPFTAGMRVQGRDAECLINGQVVVTTHFLDESLSSGGVGFKTWDRTPGVSAMFVSKVSVKPL
jgi:peptidoglycan/xylan/chitin deacetylase (PgdA/CDA1 family)